MKVYLAGRITGLPYNEAFDKFRYWANVLGVNYEVINPMELCPQNISWEESMKLCIKEMMDCEKAFFIQGWEQSTGAFLEYYICKNLKIPTHILND